VMPRDAERHFRWGADRLMHSGGSLPSALTVGRDRGVVEVLAGA
jgi:hypothetical protein